jgi:hypothetical protein
MIVHRAPSRTDWPAGRLAGLSHVLRAAVACDRVSHDDAVAALIAIGEIEAGVADALCPLRDDVMPVLEHLRAATIAAAELVGLSWDRAPQSLLTPAARGLADTCAALSAERLPACVRTGVPEGYASDGVYPETYVAAARAFARGAREPRRAVCIGVRGIGTGLSAIVAATLRAAAWQVVSYTVRPRGHPLQRQITLAPGLERAWRAAADGGSVFLVVDDGPGESGSSFAGVARALGALGIADRRIVFFPSRVPDESKLLSPDARDVWPRIRTYSATFDSVWRDSGRLDAALGAPTTDVSAGRWRRRVFGWHWPAYPAVYPRHERRKFLAPDPAGRGTLLHKFAGLGSYGVATMLRAERLAAAGIAPAPRGLTHGFLSSEFVAGRRGSAVYVDPTLLRAVAEYLAFVAATFRAGGGTRWDALVSMIRINVTEVLGSDRGLGWLDDYRDMVEDAPAVALDGRMMPHEWVRTHGRWIKTDGTDHHDDHLFPGPQDIAWDVAGTSVEFELSPAAELWMLSRFRLAGGDPDIHRRLPFYRVSYLAWRAGYASMAVRALGHGAEARRWRAQLWRYAAALGEAVVHDH